MTLSFFFKHYIKKVFYEKFVMLEYNQKRELILKYKNKFNSSIFVETGTYFGDTVAAMKKHFLKLYTIELQKDLAKKNIERFKDDDSVDVFQGNSAEVLLDIIPKLNSNSLFWLDAHYSSEFFAGGTFIQTAKADKETPILEELEIILSNGLRNNVILIDDARCFKGENDYPTITELKAFLNKKEIKNKQILVKNDIIRIFPN